jgi:hypothetical protein
MFQVSEKTYVGIVEEKGPAGRRVFGNREVGIIGPNFLDNDLNLGL